jgi:quinol monooxygenase YgiN
MVSRIVSFTVEPSKVDTFRDALNNQFLPRLQALPGFVENLESLDPQTGKFCCVTVWKTPADEQHYANGLFQEVATAVTPLLQVGPRVDTLPVENSSTHGVKAGAAAA